MCVYCMWSNNISILTEKNLIKFYKIMLIQMKHFMLSIGLFLHFGHIAMARSAFAPPIKPNITNLAQLNLTDIYETAANDVSKAIKKAINILTSVHDDAVAEHEQHEPEPEHEPAQKEREDGKPHNEKVKEAPLIHLSEIEELNKQYFDDFDIDLGTPHKYKSYLTDPNYEKTKPGAHLNNKNEPEPQGGDRKSAKDGEGGEGGGDSGDRGDDESGEHDTDANQGNTDSHTDSPAPKSSEDYDYEDETPDKVSHKPSSKKSPKTGEDYDTDDESEPENKSSQSHDEDEGEDDTRPSKKKPKSSSKSKPSSKAPSSEEDYDYDDNTSSEAPKAKNTGKKSRNSGRGSSSDEPEENHPKNQSPFRKYSISYSDDIKHGENPNNKQFGNKPFENKPFDNKPFDDKPYDNKPLFDNKPFDNKPFDSKPFDNKPFRHAMDAYTDELYGTAPTIKKKKPRAQSSRGHESDQSDHSGDHQDERDNTSSRNSKTKRKNRKSPLHSDDNRKHDQHSPVDRDSKQGRARYSGGGGRGSKADCPDD